MWQKCPVCEGHGNVPGGFYTAVSGQPWTSTATEPCIACNGSGVFSMKMIKLLKDMISARASILGPGSQRHEIKFCDVFPETTKEIQEFLAKLEDKQ